MDYGYYLQSKEHALQIPDIKTALNVLKLININPKGRGIKSKDDIVALLIAELDKGPVNHPTPDPERKQSKGLKKVVEDDQSNRNQLISKYEALQALYKELPAKYQNDLKQVFTGIEEDFEIRKTELKTSECTVLVAGETASGKSSLINLLLGGVDLLPTSQLGCTSTICEIRSNSEGKKEATGYYRCVQPDFNLDDKVIFNLNTPEGMGKFKLAASTTDEEGESLFERIEITWPFPMLEEGIVIVDTPGIGGSGNLAKYAEKYLSKSYGFIYVINSANTGGVQKGRLQNFLRTVVNAAGEEEFTSLSTMFVCNRWEMVPEQDQEAVKRDTMEKLCKVYTNLKSSQVHYMSVTEALKDVDSNTMTADHRKLLDLVENLLPESLRSRLNAHYRWLTTVLKRITYTLKVSKVMAAKSMENVKEKLDQIQHQVEKLEQNSKDSINYLRFSISTESEIVTKKVVDVLQSEEMFAKLFDWRPEDCPRADNKKKVAEDAIERISHKIAIAINFWERENNILNSIKDNIVRVCKRDFELMEEQIANIQGALLDGDVKIVHDLQKSIKAPAAPNRIWKKENEARLEEESSSYKGLGGFIVAAGSLKCSDTTVENLFSDYQEEDTKSVAKMQDATKLFLDIFLEIKHFRERVHSFFKRFVKGIDAVAKMIPDFLKADLRLMEMLTHEIDDIKVHLEHLFPRLLHESNALLGQLDLFFVKYVMVFDYKLDDLSWDLSCPPIGSGSFADVYLAEIKPSRRSRGSVAVALKVFRDTLKEKTVSDILLEDRTMRELKHPNVVRYFGATLKHKDEARQKDMQWIMILEVCKYTLKEKFVNPEVKNPGKCTPNSEDQIQAMLMMADFACQLCSGVNYLHQKGYVHRDLKLDNILVTALNVVKLTDLGLTKKTTNIAFSLVGSPVYMAPEILLQYQNWGEKADVYSIAMMLWEMWYGKEAAEFIEEQLFEPLDKAVRNGLRPSLKLATTPPEPWVQHIESSWAFNPDRRPAVSTLCKFFGEFIRDTKKM